MKGKDLIAAILEHHLEEYDFPICGEDGMFVNYISIEEARKLYKVPISTLRKIVRNKNIEVINILNKELIKKEDLEQQLQKHNSFKTYSLNKWRDKTHEFSSKNNA